jgi:hypothetical protein
MVETGSILGRCLVGNAKLSPFPPLPPLEMSQLFFGLLGAASNSLPSGIYAALVITETACRYRRKESLPQ